MMELNQKHLICLKRKDINALHQVGYGILEDQLALR